jgi:hypothetical protein
LFVGAWWEVDLGEGVAVSRIVIYNRIDADHYSLTTGRLSNSLVLLKDNQGNTLKTYRIGDATNVPMFEFKKNSYVEEKCDELLQQFHRFNEELSIQGKWQGGSVTGVCRGWGTNKVRTIVHYSLDRLGDH